MALLQPRQIRAAFELRAKISIQVAEGVIQTSELRDLQDVYIDLSLDEGPIEMEPFLKRVGSGEFGKYPPKLVRDFLYDRESEMVANMRIRAGASPNLYDDLEERAQEIREWIEDLARRYAS